MLSTEELSTPTAEMIPATSPATFFSRVQHIEQRICAQTLEILQSRNWEGPLTDQDWRFAEALVLDPVTVTSAVRNGGVLYRLKINGYRADDILLHLEGELLCVCGYAAQVEESPRMFYTRIKIPEAFRGCRQAAWMDDASLSIAMFRNQIPQASPLPMVPASTLTPALTYAAAG